MNKNELLELSKEVIGFDTKKQSGEFLDDVDKLFEGLANKLEVGQKVRIGQYITLEKKFVEEKSGVALGKEYTTPAHDVLKVKGTSLLKKLV